MKEEAAQLVGIRNEQLAEELLTPLLQACEAANKSHRAIETELLRAGFGPGSTGSAKALFDKFATAVGSTAKLPFSDAPWRLVRDVAISLNNDSSAPRAAENLIQGILDFADRHPPTAEMIKALREDQRIVRKNQVEADLARVSGSEMGRGRKACGTATTLETDEENLKSARQIFARRCPPSARPWSVLAGFGASRPQVFSSGSWRATITTGRGPRTTGLHPHRIRPRRPVRPRRTETTLSSRSILAKRCRRSVPDYLCRARTSATAPTKVSDSKPRGR